jgi:hypothetical protein
MKSQFNFSEYIALRVCLKLILILFLVSGCSGDSQMFTVADEPWPESLGSHRAVLRIQGNEEAVHIRIPWRRHDPDPQDRMLLLISAQSNDTVPNIHRIRVDREICEIFAGPVKAGTHYLYYLPYEVPAVTLEKIEARTAFDNFFPMKVIPFESEKTAFLKNHPAPFLLFTEERRHPVRMLDEIPLRWIQDPRLNHFEGIAQRNEYYTFQVALWATNAEIDGLQVSFSRLEGPGNSFIGPDKLTCFNTEGVDS